MKERKKWARKIIVSTAAINYLVKIFNVVYTVESTHQHRRWCFFFFKCVRETINTEQLNRCCFSFRPLLALFYESFARSFFFGNLLVKRYLYHYGWDHGDLFFPLLFCTSWTLSLQSRSITSSPSHNFRFRIRIASCSHGALTASDDLLFSHSVIWAK